MIVGTQVLALGLCAHAYGTYFMGERTPGSTACARAFASSTACCWAALFVAGRGWSMGGVHRRDLDLARLRLARRRTPRGGRGVARDRRHPDLLLLLPAVDSRSAPSLACGRCAGSRRPSSPVTRGCGVRHWSRRVPLVALIAFYCLRPRDYYTGTNNVEAYTYIAPTPAGEPVCVPGLQIPAGTGRIRLQLISATTRSPGVEAGAHARRGRSRATITPPAPHAGVRRLASASLTFRSRRCRRQSRASSRRRCASPPRTSSTGAGRPAAAAHAALRRHSAGLRSRDASPSGICRRRARSAATSRGPRRSCAAPRCFGPTSSGPGCTC